MSRASVAAALLATAAVVVPVAAPTVLAAPPVPVLAADLLPGADSSFPIAIGEAGGRIIVSAFTDATGSELFVYDPTTGATALVADIDPGTASSTPILVAQLDGRVLFEADDPTNGRELWVTDGTTAGTRLVKDIAPGAFSGFQQQLDGTPTWNGFAYFTADDRVSGEELWRSDGTLAGTTLVADLSPDNLDTFVAEAAPTGDRLYVVAEPSGGARQLFSTDGTPAGTSPVAPLVEVEEIEVVGSTLLLSARAGVGGFDLWRSDGTTAGTTPVVATPDDVFDVVSITAAGDRAYFFGSSSTTGDVGVWRTDGTPAGTFELYSTASFQAVPRTIYPLGTGALLAAVEPATGNELYLTDGTPAGTRVVDLVAGPTGSFWNPLQGGELQGWRYFVATAPGPLEDLWRTDGVTTERITNPADPSDVGGGAVIGDRVFFDGSTAALGNELWTIDLTPPAPAAPAAPVATAGSLSASVSWAAVADVPFAPVTGYTVTASPGGATCATTGALTCTVSGLSAGVSYTFTVVAASRIGSSPVSAASNAVVPVAPPLVPLVPGRILETRVGADLKTVDAQFQGVGRVAAGSTLELPVAGRATVPVDASAVMLNVTAVGPDGAGFVTVFPCGEDRPNASSVNYQAGQVVPNAVLAKIGAGGKVCLFTTAATDLLVDVNGAVPAGGSPVTVVPARLLETRSGQGLDTVDGQFQGVGRVPAGGTVELTVAGRGNVPVNAAAVMVNVTAVGPAAAGFLTVFPCGEDKPNASSVNYQAGQVVPNAVLAKVGAGGKVCIFSLSATDVLVDVNGFVPLGSKPSTVSPARLLETRTGPDLKTVDGQFQGVGRVAANTTLELPVTGRGNVPADASAVMVNVTAVAPDGAGFLTVFPCGEDKPNASSVNYQAGQVVPNAVLAKVGAGGKICIFSLAATDLLVDVTAST